MFRYGDNGDEQFDGLCQSENSDYRDNHNVIGTSTITKKALASLWRVVCSSSSCWNYPVARTNILYSLSAQFVSSSVCLYIWTHSDFQDDSLGKCYLAFTMDLEFLIGGIFLNARRNGFCRGTVRVEVF